jgi:hypothetical protein
VPAQAPRQRYSLLVFVPPWDAATVPPQWISTLDGHEMIFVSAANSGNDANVLDRREPLALLALLKDPKPDARKLAERRARIDRELNSELSQVEAAAAGGRIDRARRLLERIDARYGGLAAPRSIELVHRLSDPLGSSVPPLGEDTQFLVWR